MSALASKSNRPPIFVFGSNLRGIHGAGAALAAKKFHGALQGQGEGLQGNSYAIPTKSTPYIRMSIEEVSIHVDRFKTFARKNPQLRFQVTAIGTGLAGFTADQIGPMFADAPDNCSLCKEFERHRKLPEPNDSGQPQMSIPDVHEQRKR